MRRLLTVLTALIFAACGGDPTGPGGTEIPDGPLAMALVSGGGQEVTVTDTLPTDIVVRVEKGGVALPDQLVDWTVLHDNCGSPFVSTTRTDAEGQTGNRLVAGTRAWTRPDGPDVCQMEVRYALTVADTVQARVDTTVSYRVEPAEWTGGEVGHGIGTSGSSPLMLDALDDHITDQYGNPALWRAEVDSFAHVASSEYGTADAKTLVADSAGSAVVCIRTDSDLVVPGLIEVGGDGSMSFTTQGHSDTTNAYGQVQRNDCQ